MINSEVNAVLFADKPLDGCTLYTWPFSSCAACAAVVIQKGISRCVAPPLPSHLAERWGGQVALATQQFKEAGVELVLLDHI